MGFCKNYNLAANRIYRVILTKHHKHYRFTIGLPKLDKGGSVNDTGRARKTTTDTSIMAARTCGVVPPAYTHS